MKLEYLLTTVKKALRASGIDDSYEITQGAWWLIEALTKKSQAYLLVHDEVVWSVAQQNQLDLWLYQLSHEHKPLQYLLGTVPFKELEIIVEPPILIPRPETEEMVDWLIQEIKKAGVEEIRILDLCTGTGCIGLALARAFPRAVVVGSDKNPQAIALAEKNKKHNKVSNISFLISDLFDALDQGMLFDIIISNPPYLSEEAFEQVALNIKHWEDKEALVADDAGMALYARIIKEAPCFLRSTDQQCLIPCLVFEIGYEQHLIESVMKAGEFHDIQIFSDMQGMHRWVAAWGFDSLRNFS